MIQIPSKPCDFQKSAGGGGGSGGKNFPSLFSIMNPCSERIPSMCFQSSADGSLAGGHFQEAVDIIDVALY